MLIFVTNSVHPEHGGPAWCVSYMTTTQPRSDVTVLNVHRSRDLPNKWGGIGVSEYHPLHGTIYPNLREARDAAVAAGLLRPYVPSRNHRESS